MRKPHVFYVEGSKRYHESLGFEELHVHNLQKLGDVLENAGLSGEIFRSRTIVEKSRQSFRNFEDQGRPERLKFLSEALGAHS